MGALLLPLWVSAGCADAGRSSAELTLGQLPIAESLVRELEGLSFVPNGRTFIGSSLNVGSSVDLLVDRYEVRNSLWERWVGEVDPIPAVYRPGSSLADTRPKPEAWTSEVPVVGMTLGEAREFAERRGMRLPTFDEWFWCAVGPTCRGLPAGRRQRGFANTFEIRLNRSTPVGAFESGQTPETGIYDMLGNVWEWIEPPSDRRRGNWGVWNDAAWPGRGRNAPTWALGGSFMTQDFRLYSRGQLLALALTERHRSTEVGFRCCVDADVYLGALPDGALLAQAQIRRLEAVGARWGSRATGILEELLEAAPNQAWLRALQRGVERKNAQ